MIRIARITCCLCSAAWVLASAPAMAQMGTPSGFPQRWIRPLRRLPIPPHHHVFAGSVPCPGIAPTPDPMAVGPAPMTTLNGTIQAPPPWAPYAHRERARRAYCPRGPYLDWGNPAATMAQVQRFIPGSAPIITIFAPEGSKPLGFNEIELTSTLAIPFLRNAQTPLLITPGFATYFWQGPDSTAFPRRRPICRPTRSTPIWTRRGIRR